MFFTGKLDLVEGAAASTFWLSPSSTRGSLPSGDANGAARNVLDEESMTALE